MNTRPETCISPHIIEGKRCIGEPMYAHGKGVPKFCGEHFAICHPLYERYKESCKRPKAMSPCPQIEDLEEKTLEELRFLSAEIGHKYNLYDTCLRDRENFQKQCIYPACEDLEHKIFYDRLYKKRDYCNDLRHQINSLIIQKERQTERLIRQEEQRRKAEIETIERREEELRRRIGQRTPKKKQPRQRERTIKPEDEEQYIAESILRREEEEQKIMQTKQSIINSIKQYFKDIHIDPESAIITIMYTFPKARRKEMVNIVMQIKEDTYDKVLNDYLNELVNLNLSELEFLKQKIVDYRLTYRVSPDTFLYVMGKLLNPKYTDDKLIRDYQIRKNRDYSHEKEQLVNKIIRTLNEKYNLKPIKPVDPKNIIEVNELYIETSDFLTKIESFIDMNIDKAIIDMAIDKLLPLMFRTGKPIEKLFLLSYLDEPELERLYDYIMKS